MAECARLESGYTERYREFESRLLRAVENNCREKAGIPKGIASSNLAPSANF
ncbi:MAG: hypothetical protein UX53_C0030G0001 [Candidatus Azambacteria bacterium GW2011_GWB2_46_37]|uniref:Uncharacterized protein n=3 Tax=Candidatus Azamiibacteriota TaxID=1752741 RepID=A0A0G1NPS0_9BACT|nr:MAG: hypothetical protein UX33_C0013G0006 [Candidatus Azambacteria bacterium GW2011_GWC1_46_13]KKU34412.1 MAG: hypothetical protein UX48_C0038G0001 [Candidatus Azambacteria bacterium GW2011_GWB1_46_27]KKU38475.1 MAG: hypothetical protein UX53_C0030G0001 [Candidatus Azambacteria bacterium GW2011_GWB2_46_37]